VARAATTTVPAETATSRTTTGKSDGRPGKCKDPEHRLDPDCDPRSADDDDSSAKGSSGGGSSTSGSGGGDEESSDHGTGDDD
jgi:hypothetical protein